MADHQNSLPWMSFIRLSKGEHFHKMNSSLPAGIGDKICRTKSPQLSNNAWEVSWAAQPTHRGGLPGVHSALRAPPHSIFPRPFQCAGGRGSNPDRPDPSEAQCAAVTLPGPCLSQPAPAMLCESTASAAVLPVRTGKHLRKLMQRQWRGPWPAELES